MDTAPRRCISSSSHLSEFLSSKTYSGFVEFVHKLNSAALGKENVDVSKCQEDSGVVKVIGLLNEAKKVLDGFPPLKGGSRFGNAAFRSWLDKIRDDSVEKMKMFTEESAEEIAGYWWNSFGNRTRLDYGTGHEASFVVWLYALYQLGACQNLENLVLCVFPVYIELAHTVQTLYRLEPAGSHGVWSLDDYHFLPFVFGSAQLCNTQGRSLGSKPSAIRDTMILESLKDSNMYMRSILRIAEVKTGPFTEHSPLLSDISKIPKWDKVNQGLLEMFEGEVLKKFPVAQHFLFGRKFFICSWEVSEAELSKLDTASTATNTSNTQYKSPFEAVVRKTGGDALTTYFGISRRPQYQVQQQKAKEESAKYELIGDSGIKIGGCVVTTSKGRISSDTEIDEMKKGYPQLDFPLPEMLFGSNKFLCKFAEKASFEFDVMDALCGCKIVRGEDGEPDRTIFKVTNAEEWSKRTDNKGETIKSWRDDYDWTYTTTYNGTVKDCVEEVNKSEEIDYELLKRREPILFFDSITLYEDDLFDNGESKYTVKVRVMPSCLFCLGRFWLRVDGTFLRCFDTRLFHVFGQRYFLVEVTTKEGKVESLGGLSLKEQMDEAKVDKILPVIGKTTKKYKF